MASPFYSTQCPRYSLDHQIRPFFHHYIIRAYTIFMFVCDHVIYYVIVYPITIRAAASMIMSCTLSNVGYDERSCMAGRDHLWQPQVGGGGRRSQMQYSKWSSRTTCIADHLQHGSTQQPTCTNLEIKFR